MFKWLARNKVQPIHLYPGDSLVVTYTDPESGRKEIVATTFTNMLVVDTIAIGEFRNELGFEQGVVAVMGKEKI